MYVQTSVINDQTTSTELFYGSAGCNLQINNLFFVKLMIQ